MKNIVSRFALAEVATPILNTPHFDQIYGEKLPLDEQGLLRAVETIALPGTKFEILDECGDFIVQVKTRDYPYENLFVDRRFLSSASSETPERKQILPSSAALLDHLEALVGTPYVWGGNESRGIPELLHYYPPKAALDSNTAIHWALKGVDCSGLLYEVTQGFTPRNTSQLVKYGAPLNIQGKTIREICTLVKPLDAIVWKGHVVFVFDEMTTIESRLGKGTIFTPLSERLEEIFSSGHQPVNDWETTEHIGPRFVIRRWHPSR